MGQEPEELRSQLEFFTSLESSNHDLLIASELADIYELIGKLYVTDNIPEDVYNRIHSLLSQLSSHKLTKELDKTPVLAKIKKYQKDHYEKQKAKCEPCSHINRFLPPVQDQGDTNLCFAYTAADLISSYLGNALSNSSAKKPHSGSFFVSTADVAESYFEAYGDHNLPFSEHMKPGVVKETLEAALRKGFDKGFCYDYQFASDNFDNKLLTRIKAIENLAGNLNKTNFSSRACYDTRDIPLLPDLRKIIARSNKENVIGNIFDSECMRTPTNLKIIPQVEHVSIHNTFIADLHAALDANICNGPVSVVFSNDLFEHPDNPKQSGNHAATLVMRKFNNSTGNCEYTMKNSWGTSCGFYPEPPFSCNNGYITIPGYYLFNSLREINYLKVN